MVILLFFNFHSSAEIFTLEQWLDLGWDYFNANKIDEAFNTFLQAVEKYPESAEARLALAETYMEKTSPIAPRPKFSPLWNSAVNPPSQRAAIIFTDI
ncbi:MAG: tetratricopeptide repeat protein [bacterium]